MSKRARAVWRLIYVSALLFITLVVSISGTKEELTHLIQYIESGLEQVSPGYLGYSVLHGFWTGLARLSGHLPPISEQDRLLYEQIEPPPRSGGWVGIIVLSIAFAIAYKSQAGGHPVMRVVGAIFSSSVVAFLLKWLLILFVYGLGAFIGFVGWLNALVVTVMETSLHLLHIYKGGKEVGDAVEEVGKIVNPKG
jgi:hypothetical protein